MIIFGFGRKTRKDHGPAFYRLFEQAMPDWRERKQELEAFMAPLRR